MVKVAFDMVRYIGPIHALFGVWDIFIKRIGWAKIKFEAVTVDA